MSDYKKSIKLTIKGLAEARQKIADYPQKCRAVLKNDAVLREIGTTLVASAVKTINVGGRPTYKPLAASTTAAKLKKYKKASHILVAGGQLRQSIDYHVQSGTLTLTSVEYLKYHQFEENRKSTLPARPIWAVHEEDHLDIQEIITDRLT